MTKPTLQIQHARNARRLSRAFRYDGAVAPYVQAGARPWVRNVARVVLAVLLCESTLAGLPAYAQSAPTTPSASAPAGQRPIMDAAQNGVPIVHIAPPSAAGVSRNQYDQFNVNSNGLILNNSPTNVQTQQGGWITGNLQLGSTPARIILNEVVTANPSQLRGTIEIAGQRADIVIANPNGISCDGCGFLNTGRATLTTGQTQFGSGGAIQGFDVRQGQLTVGGSGLNASNLEQLDLIARGMVIEGEVWAKNLNVIAGANSVLYGTLQAAVQTGAGAAPRFAIDIKDLGGMYANQVYLVSTEQGLGVNSTGRTAALQGNLVLSASGDLTLKDSYAKQNIQINGAGNVSLTGLTQSESATAVTASGALTNLGAIDSAARLDLHANAIANAGSITQRNTDGAALTAAGQVSNTGSMYSAGPLSITGAGIADTNGSLQSSGDLRLQAGSIALSGTQMATDANAVLAANGGSLTAQNTRLRANGDLNASATAALDTTGSDWQAVGNASLSGASVANRNGTLLANGQLTVNAAGAIDNTDGKLLASGNLTLNGQSLVNARGQVASDAGTSVQVSTGIDNRGGVISAKTDLAIETQASTLSNAAGTLVADGALTVNSGQLNNDGGTIVARGAQNGALAITAAALSNRQGIIDAAAALTVISTGAVDNSNGAMQSGTAAGVASGTTRIESSSLNNTGGYIVARDAITVTTGSLTNDKTGANRGTIASSTGATTVTAGQTSNIGGVITGATVTTITTQALDNTGGELSSGAQLAINTNGKTLTNDGGKLLAGADITIHSGLLSSNAVAIANGMQAARIDATDGIDIHATGISNNGSAVSAGKDIGIALGSGAFTNTGGTIDAVGGIAVVGGAVGNRSGTITVNKTVDLTAASVDNTDGMIDADALSITSAAAVDNTRGKIASNNNLDVYAASLNNNSGIISAAKAANVQLGSGLLDNMQGQLIGAHALAVQSGEIRNRAGTIATASALALDTQGKDLDNAGGILQSGGALTIATVVLNNIGGKLNSGTATTVESLALDNTLGEISAAKSVTNSQSSGDVSINTHGQSLSNDGGRIVAQGDLQVRAGGVLDRTASNGTVQSGIIAADGNTTLTVRDLDLSGGSIQAGQDLNLTASGAVTNLNGALLSGRDVSLQVNSLTQSGSGTTEAGRDLSVTAIGALGNSGNLLAQAKADIHAASINNDGGTLASTLGMTLTTGQLDNRAVTTAGVTRAGQIIGTTALKIASTALDNTGGIIGSQGDVVIDTHLQDLNNSNGIIRTQNNLTIIAGNIVNHGVDADTAQAVGVIAADKASTIDAANLDNTGGSISAGAALGITASAALTNDNGRILSDGSGDIKAASLVNSNAARITAVTTLKVDTGAGALNNVAGTLAALGNLTVNSGALVNSGTLASVQGSQTINTHGQSLTNDGGKLQAAGDLTVLAGATSNQNGGLLSGQNLTLTLGTLNNAGGQVIAAGTLAASTQRLNNDAGLIQSVGDAVINTHGQALDNTNSGNTGGIVSSAALNVQSGSLNNQNGFIASSGNHTLTITGAADNRGGSISSNGHTTLSAATFDNRGGRINAKGNLGVVVAALLDNRGGNLTADGTATLSAATIDNSSNNGSVGVIDATNIGLTATTFNNRQGVLRAANNAIINGTTLDNSYGSLSAKGTLNITAPNLNNSNGEIIGDNGVVIRTSSPTLGGTIAAQKDVTLTVDGDYTNTGLLSAQKNLTINAANITNSGTLKANDTLTANTGNLNNSGEISATTTQINATGTLTNSGLIDGTTTSINAATTNNTGRIYGDLLSIQSGTLNNSGTGTLAARDSMFLGGTTLSNTNHATIYANNDIFLAGSLDQNGQPQGEMNYLLNASSTIEAGGNITLSVANLLNRNDGLQTGMQSTITPVNITLIQPDGSTVKYNVGDLGWKPGCDTTLGCYVTPSATYPFAQFGAVERGAASHTVCPNADDGGACVTTYTYLPTDPIWTLFKVPAADFSDLTPPVAPGYSCMETSADSGPMRTTSGACGTYWTAADAYVLAVDQRSASAAAALDTVLAIFNADVEARFASRWNEYQITSRSVDETIITATDPAKIKAGAALTIQGNGSKINDNSNLIAGGALTVIGTAVDNQGVQGTRSVTDIGQVRYRDHKYHSGGAFGSASTEELLTAWTPTTGAPELSSPYLSDFVYQKNGGNKVDPQDQPGSTASAATNLAYSAGSAAGNDRNASGAAVSAQVDNVRALIPRSLTPGSVNMRSVALGATTANALVAGPADHRPLTIQSFAAAGTGERAHDVILSVAPRLNIPTSSLFVLHASPSARFLVETDPRFTNHRTFISSDYFLQALNRDPERQLKRYGDGFVEQQLINDQILALTGRRYLDGYSKTETEYQRLMDAGVVFARQYQLTPGVALSAGQMALLTSDIVWLTTRTVTLADGSTQQVLAPQVYLRRPADGDLQTGGALIAGSEILIKTEGDLVNSGTIGGNNVTLLAGNDLVNQNGRISGQDILMRANNDLKNLSGVIQGSGTDSSVTLLAGRDIVLQTQTRDSTSSDGNSTRTSVQRIATVQGGSISLQAARDIVAMGADVSAGQDLILNAGRHFTAGTVEASVHNRTDLTQASGNASIMGRTGYIDETSTTEQITRLQAGNNLGLIAVGDVSLIGANARAGNNALVQGANVDIRAAINSTGIDVQNVNRKGYNRAATTDQTLSGGDISAGNNLTVNANGTAPAGTAPAQGNLTIAGASLTATNGQASLIGANNVTIGALGTAHATLGESYYQNSTGIKNLYTTTEQSQSAHSAQRTRLDGSSISGNTVYVQAGDQAKQTGDITQSASSITAQGAATLNAGRDVIIDVAQESSSRSDYAQSTSSFAIGPKFAETATQIVARDLLRLDPVLNKYVPPPSSSGTSAMLGNGAQSSTGSVGTSISADSLRIGSGRDTLIRGAAIVTTNDLAINAGRNLDIVTSLDQQSASQSRNETNHGLFNTGAALTTGTREVKQTSDNTAGIATSSQVASLSGNVSLSAGDTYRQTGSQVLALGQDGSGGDIRIDAKRVLIDAAHNTSADTQSTAYQQEGVTVSVSSPIISALQAIQQANDSAGKTSDPRMKALAAATAALTAYNAAKAVSDAAGSGNPASVGVSADLGHSQSQSQFSERRDTAQGSSVSAARNLSISASGDGKGSTITVTGSDLSAGNNASLKADGAILLQAAANTDALQSKDSSQNANVGVTFGGGSQNGLSFHAAASAARGTANGTDLYFTNSHVSAGNTALIQSGGDTTLNGAVIAADSVKADVQGNLTVGSLQDISTYDSKSHTAGGSVSVCIPPICIGESVAYSFSLSAAKVNGDFQSVTEQSAIKTGDGGFQFIVTGNTDLQGGALTSTQAAIDAGKNSLATGTLTTSDLKNKDVYDAAGYSGSYGSGGGTAGLGMASGDQRSTTISGISAGAISITDEQKQKALTGKDSATTLASLNTTLTTDKATSGALKKAWDGEKLQQEMQAQAQITAAFGSSAAKAVGDYATGKTKPYTDAKIYEELKGRQAGGTLNEGGLAVLTKMETEGGYTPEKARATLADPQAKIDFDHWTEGGDYRVAAHTAVGALAGGVAGALGAGASARAAPMLTDLQDNLQKSLIAGGVNAGVAGALGKLASSAAATAIGAAAGGGINGAAGAFNEDLNNRQLHPRETKWISDNAKQFARDLNGGKEPTQAQIDFAEQRLAQQGYRDVQFGVPGSTDDPAEAFLKRAHGMLTDPNCPACGVSYMFHPMVDQRADVAMYADLLPQTASFYLKNGLSIPTNLQVSAATNRANAILDLDKALTTLTPLAAGGVVLGGLSPAMLTWIIGHPLEATQLGIITADTAAGIASGAITPATMVPSATGKLASVAEKEIAIAIKAANTTATQAALTQEIGSLRAVLTGNAKTGGNMGVAEINIPGIQTTMAASSQVDVPTAAQQALGFVGKVPETFPSSIVPIGIAGKEPYPLLRSVDSEAKILNNIAAKLGDNTSATGTITLLTERAPCASCSNVIEQFQTKYPNIKINVLDNGGVNVRPTKKGP